MRQDPTHSSRQHTLARPSPTIFMQALMLNIEEPPASTQPAFLNARAKAPLVHTETTRVSEHEGESPRPPPLVAFGAGSEAVTSLTRAQATRVRTRVRVCVQEAELVNATSSLRPRLAHKL